MKKLEQLIARLLRFSVPYGDSSQAWIVTSGNALPTGIKGYCIQVLADTTSLTVTDSSLVSGSPAYPATHSAGTVIYGTFTAVSVTDGTVKVYIP